MKVPNNLRLIARLHKCQAAIRVLVVSTTNTDDDDVDAIGALGLDAVEFAQTIDAVRKVRLMRAELTEQGVEVPPLDEKSFSLFDYLYELELKLSDLKERERRHYSKEETIVAHDERDDGDEYDEDEGYDFY